MRRSGGRILSVMPTPSEQKALAFLAIVVLLGGAVRVVRAGAEPAATPQEQQALARQATAAESAATHDPPRKGRRQKGLRLARPKRGAGPREIGGVVGVPIGASVTDSSPDSRNGFSPPQPRIDTDFRANRSGTSQQVRGAAQSSGTPGAIDLDHATEQEIDRLPRVGPVLARRIVANRDSFGPFGSIAGLKRVKGIGAATAERLAPLVTFSGAPSSRP
ncbi:MAG TPA: helix-hairpin-helix domain-containing protein [Gemmatimonadaceae bacterium]|nr:helix-hairpin-helix domain-containing protein [Gemmatimonadaceae bacterium]